VGCCAKGCDDFFTDRVARRDARRYRERGLDELSRRVVDTATRRGVGGRAVLEVGGGTGAVQLELLKAGAEHAVNVELSPAYEPYARALLAEAGLAGRVERRLLDFAEAAGEVAPADLVILNRVVCCYPDYETLVRAAADRTRGLMVLTFPRGSWWVRLGTRVLNVGLTLRRGTFRVFAHPPEGVIAAAEARGLRRVLSHRGALWQLVALERPGT
jgi:magnesium-protoporphyrin O-methyltransferase